MASTIGPASHRLSLSPEAARDERLGRAREMLSRALSQETLVAVVGTGCSAPLGYPTWRQMAEELVRLALDKLRERGGDGADLDRVLGFQKRLESPRGDGSLGLMFIIGHCRSLLSGLAAESDSFTHYIKRTFAFPDPLREVEHNPHRVLLELPIYRFVTTNYDCEIERALYLERRIPMSEFGILPSGIPQSAQRSFTQKPENCDQLALFSLSRVEEAKNMVFHCHGRFDDIDSIVASEADYQRWYLADGEGPQSAFLRTVDLLFGSNPILFVGYGLGDEDLLRPLRLISATERERKELRPLFALLPEPSEAADWDYHEQLFERYGVHVVPYESPPGIDPQERGRLLCEALRGLRRDSHCWRDSWFQKPFFRPVEVRAQPPQPYWHYRPESRRQETFGAERVREKLVELENAVLGGAAVLGLIGPGGTGKSWHALELLERMRGQSRIEGLFFWSSYYTDDWLTGLDRLLAYLDPHGDPRVSRLKRLREVLCRGRYLIVLDGFERLLRPRQEAIELGESFTPSVKGLLDSFAHTESISTVVLTSRLWPQELEIDGNRIRIYRLPRIETADIRDVEPFSWRPRSDVSALCSLLEGHIYGLVLAARQIRRGGRKAAEQSLFKLCQVLAEQPPDQRVSQMIREAIEGVDQASGGLARAVFEHLAVFMSPVTDAIARRCYELALAEWDGDPSTAPPVEELLDSLVSSRLLFIVRPGPGESDPSAYTTHPTVRSYVFREIYQTERDTLPNFTLAGFTSGTSSVHPGRGRSAKVVRGLFDRLHDAVREALANGRPQEAGELCRGLFGIVRSRMEANTASRWTSYSEYVRYAARLVLIAKETSPRLWRFREPHELADLEDLDAPLHADEVAFLYNDIGLSLCAEGDMADTVDIWQQGYEINRILEGGTAVIPQYSLQSQLHLGHAYLELGKLPLAEQYLAATEKTNHLVKDPDYGARILGYQALVAHLRGHLVKADEMYEDALRNLVAAGGNHRAESFFYCHRAALAVARGQFDDAERYIESGRALAEAGRARDLIAYVRTNRGSFWRERGFPDKAVMEYNAALAEARRIGIRRLEAEIFSGLARVALKLGDAEVARQRAMTALRLANELGLGLRQAHSLTVLGLATLQAGQRRLGTAYLRHALRLADGQEYWLRSREAEEALQEIGEWDADDPSSSGLW